jgi:F-type H+-transporting ATPase subunit delta
MLICSSQAVFKSQDVYVDPITPRKTSMETKLTRLDTSVQVNLAAETGDMGVLASHVPSIEQLKPGLVEVIEESGGSKQFFRMRYAIESIRHNG